MGVRGEADVRRQAGWLRLVTLVGFWFILSWFSCLVSGWRRGAFLLVDLSFALVALLRLSIVGFVHTT